jgi:hypothetical protein
MVVARGWRLEAMQEEPVEWSRLLVRSRLQWMLLFSGGLYRGGGSVYIVHITHRPGVSRSRGA